MYQRIDAERCFVRGVRKYIEKKRKVVGEADMILKESDLRRLVREVLTESEDLVKALTKSYLDFSEKNPGAGYTDFRRHLDSLMREVISGREEDDYDNWKSDLKSYFMGREKKWVKVSLSEIKPTLDEFERRGIDTRRYIRAIRRAKFAWIRFSGPRFVNGKRCAAFEVRINGSKIDHPNQLHYIDIEMLGDKIRYLNGTPTNLRLEEKFLRQTISKVIFESEGDEARVKVEDVEVVYPDVIDKDMLLKGDQDEEISGFVSPEDGSIKRAGIYFRGDLVGFMTPREEKGRWRVGAIYVDGEMRKKFRGIGSIAIAKFFEGREAADLLIGVDNEASQRAFSKAGFKNTEKEFFDKSDGWKATWWSRK